MQKLTYNKKNIIPEYACLRINPRQVFGQLESCQRGGWQTHMEADPSALQIEKQINIIQPESKSEYIAMSAISKTN
jgi:hypothetical protein